MVTFLLGIRVFSAEAPALARRGFCLSAHSHESRKPGDDPPDNGNTKPRQERHECCPDGDADSPGVFVDRRAPATVAIPTVMPEPMDVVPLVGGKRLHLL
jgi:hypothetical protein